MRPAARPATASVWLAAFLSARPAPAQLPLALVSVPPPPRRCDGTSCSRAFASTSGQHKSKRVRREEHQRFTGGSTSSSSTSGSSFHPRSAEATLESLLVALQSSPAAISLFPSVLAARASPPSARNLQLVLDALFLRHAPEQRYVQDPAPGTEQATPEERLSAALQAYDMFLLASGTPDTMVHRAILAFAGGLGDEAALEAYLFMRARFPDLKLDAALAQLVLGPLLRHPTRAKLERAKEIYADLLRNATSGAGPDKSTFYHLLVACAARTVADVAFAKQLFADVASLSKGGRDTSEPLMHSDAAARYLAALLHGLTNYYDFFGLLEAVEGVVKLDTKAHNLILGPQGLTSFDVGTLPPPAFVREYLTHMRRSDCAPDRYTYSILLTAYTRHPAMMGTEQGRETAKVFAKQLHSFVKMDLYLEPDVALYNSLMDAYSRTRSYAEAFAVWDFLALPGVGAHLGGPDATSLSIYLDTLGWCGAPSALQRGRVAWKASGRGKAGKRNAKNWGAWIELLCRYGALDEAEQAIFADSFARELGPPPPSSANVGVEYDWAGRPAVQAWLKFVRTQMGRTAYSEKKALLERKGMWNSSMEVTVAEDMQEDDAVVAP